MSVNLSPIGNGFQFFTTLWRYLYPVVIFILTKLVQQRHRTPIQRQQERLLTPTRLYWERNGRPPQEIWLTSGSNYKFILTDSSNVNIATYDNLYGILGSAPSVTSVQQVRLLCGQAQ